MGGMLGLGGGGMVASTKSGTTYPKWAEPGVREFFQDSIYLALTMFLDYEKDYGTWLGAYPTQRAGTISNYQSNFQYGSSSNASSLAGYTIAGQDSNETAGLVNLETRAKNGSPQVSKAKTLIQDIIEGKKIDGTSITTPAYNAIRDSLLQEFDEVSMPNLAQDMVMAGAFGSSVHGFMLYRHGENELNKLLKAGQEVYHGDYKTARRIQHSMLAPAITAGNERNRDAEMLRKTGMMRREFNQSLYEDGYKHYEDMQMIPVKKLEIFGNAIRMMRGTSSTHVEPYYRPSGFSELAGLSLAGLGLYTRYKQLNPDTVQDTRNLLETARTDISGVPSPVPGYDMRKV